MTTVTYQYYTPNYSIPTPGPDISNSSYIYSNIPIPVNASSVQITAIGGGGGNSGGNGATVTATYSLYPSTTLTINLGAGGASRSGSFGNNNGDGGGLSQVISISDSTINLIAGGGGGGGGIGLPGGGNGGSGGIDVSGNGGNGTGSGHGAGAIGSVGGLRGGGNSGQNGNNLNQSAYGGAGYYSSRYGGTGSASAGGGGSGYAGGGGAGYQFNGGGGAGSSIALGSNLISSPIYSSTSGNGGISGHNGEDGSVIVAFTITTPPPTITAITLNSIIESVSQFTIVGNNFINTPNVLSITGQLSNIQIQTVSSSSITFTSSTVTGTNLQITVTNSDGQTASSSYTFIPPTITAITLNSIIESVSQFTIVGNNFINTPNLLSITGQLSNIQIQSVSSLSITFTTSTITGTDLSITVTNSDGQTASSSYTFIPPRINSIFESSAPAGSTVTINGLDFISTPTVKIGTFPCTVVGFTSSNSITCTIPAGSGNNLIVVVTNPDGQSSTQTTVLFSYISPPTISSISPTQGTIGQLIDISGSNFVSGATVTLNGVLCDSIGFSSSSKITCTVPFITAGDGSYNLIVINPDDLSSNSISFYYVSPNPVITSLSASAQGTYNDSITITGQYFYGNPIVSFNDISCTSTLINSSNISFHIPFISAGNGSYNLFVINPNNLSSNILSFTYQNPLPSISRFSPSSGTAGDTIDISGISFVQGLTLDLSNTPCTLISFDNSSNIKCSVPFIPTNSNSYYFSVANPGTTRVTYTGNSFNYISPPPTITSFYPSDGISDSLITVVGTNFLSSSIVTINDISAIPLTVSPDGITLTFLAPTNPNGNYLIKVKNLNATATSLNTFTYRQLIYTSSGQSQSLNTSSILTKNYYITKSPGVVGNVTLYVSNDTPGVKPVGQIFIDCIGITIEGSGNTFNFNEVTNYSGLFVIRGANGTNGNGNRTRLMRTNYRDIPPPIIIQNVHIVINGVSTLLLPYGGWICQGGSDGLTSVTINNCSVTSPDDININISNNLGFSTGYCGIICGGGNGIGADGSNNTNINGSDGNGGIYSFNNCVVNAANNINFTAFQEISLVGGICGGGNGGGGAGITSNTIDTSGGNGGKGNGGTYSFNGCQVNGTININGILLYNGLICGGFNGTGGGGGDANGIGSGGNGGDASGGTYTFTDCSVNGNNIEIRDISSGSITLIAFGGICGGGNGNSDAGGNAYISGNGGNIGNCYGGNYTFQDCSVISNNNFDISGIYILSGGICGGLNGASLAKSGDSTILGNGGNGGNNNGGIYIFNSSYVNTNNNFNITGFYIISGGICGGANGSTSFLTGSGGNGNNGNGGNGNNGNGGNYTFNNCSVDAINGNIQLTGNPIIGFFFCFYGGICGGINGIGGNGGNTNTVNGGTGGNGGDGFSGIYDFSSCTVIADKNIILPVVPTLALLFNKSGGICSGANGEPGFGGSGTQSGQNGLNIGGEYTFSVCLVECCEFIYDGVIIEAPGLLEQQLGLIIGADQLGNTIIDDESYLIETCIPPPPPIPQPNNPICCPLKIYGNKPGTIFGGSGSGVQGAHQSEIINRAQVLKNTASRLAGKTIFLNKQINVYGSYYGAPGGSGAPPRNSF